MKILILGGTRLLGKALVRSLFHKHYDITIISKNPGEWRGDIKIIKEYREKGIIKLKKAQFDIVLDFIAYNDKDVLQIQKNIDYKAYVLMSSVWLTYLCPGLRADQPVPKVNARLAEHMPLATCRYLKGKMMAERVVLKMWEKRCNMFSLRLPIFFGEYEHTGRLSFYIQRIKDGYPVMLINGGQNTVQIAWTEDLAMAIEKWMGIAKDAPIWEALPKKGIKVKDLLVLIYEYLKMDKNFIAISEKKLSDALPAYLKNEPLWREDYIYPTKHNLFKVISSRQTETKEWLVKIIKFQGDSDISALRKREIAFLKGI